MKQPHYRPVVIAHKSGYFATVEDRMGNRILMVYPAFRSEEQAQKSAIAAARNLELRMDILVQNN